MKKGAWFAIHADFLNAASSSREVPGIDVRNRILIMTIVLAVGKYTGSYIKI